MNPPAPSCLLLKSEFYVWFFSLYLLQCTTALSNSMKLWAMPCRATQEGQVMVESSDKTWSTGEGNGKPLFCIVPLKTPWEVWKGKKIWHWKTNSPGSHTQHIQLWMWLVIEVKSDAVKNNIVWVPGMLGPWIKVNGNWSNKRWREWTLAC